MGNNNGKSENSKITLEGLKVIDLCDEKGSFCTKLFADLGADVIKVEKPGGDLTRNIGPFLNDDIHPEKSLYFANNNTNKRSITLNVESTRGQEIFKKLIEGRDVLVETFLPGYMARLGLDYPRLRLLNSRLVMTSVTSFGQTGPYKHFKSSEIVDFAMSGLMYQTGDADMPPLLAGGLQTYYLASLFAAVATLMALYDRDKTGQGQHVDVSVQECVATCLEIMCYYTYEGHIISRAGARHHEACPSDNYPCQDGYWSICVGPYSQMWSKLISWIIRDGIDIGNLADKEYEIGAKRRSVIDTVINPLLRQWSKSYTKAEIFKIAQENDIAIAPISSIKDVAEDIQLSDRDFFVQIAHPIIGTAKYPGHPWQHSANSKRMKRAPLVGEHNQEVYSELGFSNEDVICLRKTGII